MLTSETHQMMMQTEEETDKRTTNVTMALFFIGPSGRDSEIKSGELKNCVRMKIPQS